MRYAVSAPLPRAALCLVIAALVAASLFVGATIMLARWRTGLGEQTLAVPIDNMALPLDMQGTGLQIVSGTVLKATVKPWPPRADTAESLTLSANDDATGAMRAVTPTLEIAPSDQVDGTRFLLVSLSPGRYIARGTFFSSGQAARWRMRVRLSLPGGEPYTMLILANTPDIPNTPSGPSPSTGR